MRGLHGVFKISFLAVGTLLWVACASKPSAEDISETMVAETAAAHTILTLEAELSRVTETQLAQETIAAEATQLIQLSTEAAAVRATRLAETAQANDQATQAAEPMAALIEELVTTGYIRSSDGWYFRLDPFNESYAAGPETSQDDFFSDVVYYYYNYYSTGFDPGNFILRANIRWENVDEYSNRTGGCGYAFRVNPDSGNHYLTWLSGYGQLNYIRNVNFSSEFMKNVPTGPLGFPNGGAEFTLIVEDDTFHAFVNGEHVDTRQDTSLGAGELAFAIMSGDSRRFGTRCRMDNIDLWILEG